jgi:two-component system, NarL family, invasion response regulator UvrY
MPRILIVDDHPVVREGIGRVLTAALPGVEIGVADGAAQALDAMQSNTWDVVLLDLTLHGDDGTVILRRLRQHYADVPVVVISMHPADQFARRVLQAGALAYISKGSDPEELVAAVRTALSGGRGATTLEAEPASPQALPHEQLSDREYQVLRMIGQGRTVSEIAAELSLSVKTVSTYRARILDKMAMRTSAELMRYVIAHKLVPLPPP